MKYGDRFGACSGAYSKFRPEYPTELYEFLKTLVPGKELVWDCGTGNGQAARSLSADFKQVIATDASIMQLDQAHAPRNVSFILAEAEAPPLKTSSVDLVTCATCVHWFDHDVFYPEVRRILKPGGIFAAWTYGFFSGEDEMNEIVDRTVLRKIKSYWTEANLMCRDKYKTLPFPFEETDAPEFIIERTLGLDELCGFMQSWSAYQHYLEATGLDPLVDFKKNAAELWLPSERFQIRWELSMRVAQL